MKKVLVLLMLFVFLFSFAAFAGSTNTPGNKTVSMAVAATGDQTVYDGKFVGMFLYVDSTDAWTGTLTIKDGTTTVRIIDLETATTDNRTREIPLYGYKFETSVVVGFSTATGTVTLNGKIPIF